ncbi:MAG: aminoacyl-tRNA hydrolase [Acidobacteriota bacterium]|nr:aminoacyl-tRNA hydrolase [Acidobacteriota bacterium]
MIAVTPAIRIDERELQVAFVRASGPGGQNVNKVATAVQLRWDAARSPALSGPVLARLRRLAGRRMTGDGVLILDARRHRTQEQNRQDAIERLVQLVRQAAVPPTPRRPSKPTRASKERRLEGKARRSRLKTSRRGTGED